MSISPPIKAGDGREEQAQAVLLQAPERFSCPAENTARGAVTFETFQGGLSTLTIPT